MVSRETSEPVEVPDPPLGLREHYPAAADGLTRYAAFLAADGVTRGLIGPREVPRLWERHLLNCAVVEALIPSGATVADVGSGAGLPGVVLALVRPDLQVTLVEAMLRRATFLSEVLERLGLENVVVAKSRAEELPRTTRFDVVTSRAVAPLPKLAGWCAPMLASQGRILALKGASAATELAEAAPVLKKLKLGPGRVLEVGGEWLVPATTVVELQGPMRANPAKRRGSQPAGRKPGGGQAGGRKAGGGQAGRGKAPTKARPTERRTP